MIRDMTAPLPRPVTRGLFCARRTAAVSIALLGIRPKGVPLPHGARRRTGGPTQPRGGGGKKKKKRTRRTQLCVRYPSTSTLPPVQT